LTGYIIVNYSSFGVNNGGDKGTDYFEIKITKDTVKFTKNEN